MKPFLIDASDINSDTLFHLSTLVNNPISNISNICSDKLPEVIIASTPFVYRSITAWLPLLRYKSIT